MGSLIPSCVCEKLRRVGCVACEAIFIGVVFAVLVFIFMGRPGSCLFLPVLLLIKGVVTIVVT